MTSDKLNNELEERFLQFGVAVIRYVSKNKAYLPFSVIDRVICSSTSIGANYSEAQNAISKSDFKNKVFIAKKEASETRYWLRVIAELRLKDDISQLQQESREIIYILQKITNTLSSKKDSK